MAERINYTLESQLFDSPELKTEINENRQLIQTVIQDVPQIQTVLQNGINVSSQINAPFIEVTSVNGKTGDVITEPVVGVFEPNHYYLKNTMISYNDTLYYAKETFTSGSSFNANDWYSVEGSQITVDSALSTTSENPVQNKVITSALNNKVNSSDLAEVATSGSFTDLVNVPPFPTVNNATLTIQKNGTTVNTFTANSSTDKTANITVPTKTSDITNDSGFITAIPTASASTLGGIKVGDGLDITNTGVLSTELSIEDGSTVSTIVASITTSQIVDEAITATKIDWDSILERVEKTVTLDSTGNADLNILTADYWIIAIRERGTGTFKNAHLTPYAWSNGHYYVHGDMNYGNTYATGSINIEILMIKKSAIGM